MLFVFLSLLPLISSCSSGDNEKQNDSGSKAADGGADAATSDAGAFATNVDLATCDPESGAFTTNITNPYFPAAVGDKWVIYGKEEGDDVRVEITVLDETEIVAGVTTRVLKEREFANGSLSEVSRNFFVQNSKGTVCYFGEDVDIYEKGKVAAHEGAWRAGKKGARPGIQMPAHPQVGMAYFQEVAPKVAQDYAEITSMGDKVTVPFGKFTDTLTVIETSPLESGSSPKHYAKGIGILTDDDLKLTSCTMAK